ncbi:MAG: Grx4 family monothiol glutaredoxin [Chromatiales bacterium]|nr:Grx4 family monothiol glutaredoxin [Chromatiales bacterium]
MDDVLKRIDDQVKNHPIVLYMKGSPQFPQCGFSARAAQVLQACEVPFDYVNVLTDPDIFANLPRYADFPTFPQTYVSGELIGGSDILLEMYQKGELQPLLKEAIASHEANDDAG